MAAKRKIDESAYRKAIESSIAQSQGKIATLQAEAATLLREELAPFFSGNGIEAGSNNGVFVKDGAEFRRLAGEVLRMNSDMTEEEGFLAQLRTRLEKVATDTPNGTGPAPATPTGTPEAPPV